MAFVDGDPVIPTVGGSLEQIQESIARIPAGWRRCR